MAMSQHQRLFLLLGVIGGIVSLLAFAWWWHSRVEASEVSNTTELVTVTHVPTYSAPTVTPTQVSSETVVISPKVVTIEFLPDVNPSTSPTPVIVSVTSAPLQNQSTSSLTPTSTSTFTPTPSLTPTPIPTQAVFPITIDDLTVSGAVDLTQSLVGTVRATFGTPDTGSYLFANQLNLPLTHFGGSVILPWLNLRLRLISSELNLGFDDPAVVILLDDKPLFALSVADWQRLASTLTDGWCSISLHLPPIWGASQLTILAGDNGDLQFPTVVDLELVGLSQQPLYPLPADKITDFIPSHLSWQLVVDSVLLTTSPNHLTSPFYLAATIDRYDSTLPSFYQTNQLLWLSSNLLHDGAMVIADHPIFHPDQDTTHLLDSLELPLTLWPLNILHTIPLLPTE
jgi:hypothetical protein